MRPLDLVQEREADALAALELAAGGASLCALSRDGASHPAAKFHEGAVAALGSLRRLLLACDPAGDPGRMRDEAVTAARAAWRERYGGLAERGRDWAAYYAGGLDALDQPLDRRKTTT